MESEHTTATKSSDYHKPKDGSMAQHQATLSFGLGNSILQFHQTMGNRAVGQLIQAKLRVNQPVDKYEQEADRVAEQVMRMPDSEVGSVSQDNKKIQRKCACESGGTTCPKCAEEEEKIQLKPLASQITPLIQRQPEEGLEEDEEINPQPFIQRQTADFQQEQEELIRPKPEEQIEEEKEGIIQAKGISNDYPVVTPRIATKINALRGTGQPLPEPTRRFFEPRFGVDFSDVRIHNNSLAAYVASKINAKAFTLGNNVFFGSGEYMPESAHGKKLLSHELTHIVQENGIMNGHFAKIPSPSNSLIRRKSRGLCNTTHYNNSKGYINSTVQPGDSMEKLVRRLITSGKLQIRGRVSIYAKEMMKLNYLPGNAMHPNDCIVLKRSWKDPNIGSLKNISPTDEQKAKIIATIYAEQTQDIPEQHKYIWYSMKKRILDPSTPSDFLPKGQRGILHSGAYHAFTRANKDYIKAKEYLIKYYTKNKKPNTNVTPKFNPSIVDKIKTMVESDWNDRLPPDASMYYFHWTKRKSPVLNKCWKPIQSTLKSNKNKYKMWEIEHMTLGYINRCGRENYDHLANNKKVWPKGLKLKKYILWKPIDYNTFDPPIGTMFIFK